MDYPFDAALPLMHRYSVCGTEFALEQLPGVERLVGAGENHISFDRYVYAYCPKCGHKDWADERRYFGVLGPRGFYALVCALVSAFLIAVLVLGFSG